MSVRMLVPNDDSRAIEALKQLIERDSRFGYVEGNQVKVRFQFIDLNEIEAYTPIDERVGGVFSHEYLMGYGDRVKVPSVFKNDTGRYVISHVPKPMYRLSYLLKIGTKPICEYIGVIHLRATNLGFPKHSYDSLYDRHRRIIGPPDL